MTTTKIEIIQKACDCSTEAIVETADSACEYAVKQAISDPEFRASVKNPPDKPPAMNVEDCSEIEKDPNLQDSPFIYTPE